MFLFVGGVLLFILAFLIHLAIWRIRLPHNHTKALFAIFLIVWGAGIFLLIGLKNFFSFDSLRITFLYFSLALAYMTTYSGIEVESPSLRIVLDIAKAGRDGLDRRALDKDLTDEILVGTRFRDLVKASLIEPKGNAYKLTSKGILLVSLFIFYRRLLKAGKGG